MLSTPFKRFKLHAKESLLTVMFYLFFLNATALFATPITLYSSLAGNLNFVMAGGTLRTGADGVAPCNVAAGAVSATLSGIPIGSTVQAAYLYWAGSGATPDFDVTFNGTNVTADRQFTDTFTLGTAYDFFSGFEDVTALVSGNGTYTFDNLTVNNGTPFCPVSAVLSGWALFVIYSNPLEDFRVINTYDGLQQYRGSTLTLNPSNFRIPASPINGRLTVVTWEGDVGNSGGLGGFVEEVSVSGTPLIDAANPTNNQYNSTINTYGTATDKYGVDIDSYTIDSLLTAGQTSLTTNYSSGSDLVFLNAQIISVTNTPVSDLAVDKSHSGDFAVGSTGTYTISVTNNGPLDSATNTTVVDTLPTGLTYVSASGTGWVCTFTSPDVTCVRALPIANGATAPDITLVVAVDPAAFPSVTNTVTVSGTNFDNNSSNDTDTDPTVVAAGNLSESTKSVVDINGGEANVGDTLRYTISLVNDSAAVATSVSVTDDIPPDLNSFTVVSTPVGSTDGSTGGGTGANGNGFLNITNVTVAPMSTETIVFDVVVAGSAVPGTLIDNTADIAVPIGTGATVAAPTVVISPSLLVSTGIKDLYIETNGGSFLQRGIPSGIAEIQINGGNNTQNFLLTPQISKALTVSSGNVPVTLRMRRAGNGNVNRNVTCTLEYSDGGGGWVQLGTQTQNLTMTTAYQTHTFNLNIPADVAIPSGRDIRFNLTNATTQNNRRIRIRGFNGGITSKLRVGITPVIDIDSIIPYSAAFPSATVGTGFDGGETVYIRSVVSDPFGSADITGATIDIMDALGGAVVTGATMTSVATTASTRTYEYVYTLPTFAVPGSWGVTIVTTEGAEGLVSDTDVGSFTVNTVDLTLLKSSSVVSDPINLGSNPKRIPGAVIRYSILATNTSGGSPDTNSVVLTDPLPANTTLCVTTACNGGSNPFTFIQGTPTSGLTFTYPADVAYSNQVGGGAPFTYTPAPDGAGYDTNITGLRFNLSGTMNGSAGSPPHPNFTIQMILKIE